MKDIAVFADHKADSSCQFLVLPLRYVAFRKFGGHHPFDRCAASGLIALPSCERRFGNKDDRYDEKCQAIPVRGILHCHDFTRFPLFA